MTIGLVAVSVQQMSPGGQRERATELGERGEQSHLEGRQAELVEHEHVVEGAEAIRAKRPHRAERNEHQQRAGTQHDLQLFRQGQRDMGRVAARLGRTDPLPAEREVPHHDRRGDEELEDDDAIVPLRQ
jgi:hypothetical protein